MFILIFGKLFFISIIDFGFIWLLAKLRVQLVICLYQYIHKIQAIAGPV